MQTQFEKDPNGKKMIVTRDFNAPLADVWSAWTESELLDQWWAPRPWKAITQTMDFKNGGSWLYAMTGPDGEKHLNRVDFKTIEPPKHFTATSFFVDESGNPIESFQPMHWDNHFSETASGTQVVCHISFETTEGLEQIIQMGFEGGFNMGLSNLDELLAK
ncbi:SRPBCC domain-containing protein [Mucilaginibacter sp. HMF5004]|uniref:SRPBCC family protein n=1 Tax=Mucilaginibacter rivuli TaxID=2857527 RepID=UPI001C606831|nr:SRPBCC domain-containing protein [Mucilaginibacter rivuli]MBW4888548.1 SRPBCC domain-containing protein [Mucilaginibacter rivuli]